MEAESSAGHQYKLRRARRASARSSGAPSVDATTGQTWAKRNCRSRLKRGEACVPCVVRKARCKGGVPCLRCWEYALVCTPQDPLPASPDSASLEQPPGPAGPPSSPAAADTPAVDAHADNHPFLEAFLRQWDPTLIAPAFVAAVATLLPAAGAARVGGGLAPVGAASLLDRGLVEAAIRRWRGGARSQSMEQGLQQSMGEGMDAADAGEWSEDDGTYGVMAALQRGLLGMAGGGALVEGGRGASPGRRSAVAEEEGREEEEGVPMGALDAQVARARTLRSLIPLRQGDCGPARLLWSEGEAGSGCVAGNAAWDAGFLPAPTVLRACAASSGVVGPLGPMLLLGACVHPNDRHTFFRALVLALFGVTPRPHQRFEGTTQVIKACTASGKVGLFLLRASRATAVAAGTDILLSLEPAPPSRYIMDLAARSCAVVSPPAFLPAEAGMDRGSPRGSDDGGAPATSAGAAPGFPWGLVACPLGRGAANRDGGGGGGRGVGVRTAAEMAAAAAGVGEEEAAALFRLPSLEALAVLRSGSLRAWRLESGRRLAGDGPEEDEDEDEDKDEDYGYEQHQHLQSTSPPRQPVILQQPVLSYHPYQHLPVMVVQPQQQHPYEQLPVVAAPPLAPPQQQHGQQQLPVMVAPHEQQQQQQQQSDARQHAPSPWLGALPLSPLDAAAEPSFDVSVLDGMFLDDRWMEMDLGESD